MAQSGVLKATKRTQLGTRASRKLRSSGRIPGNLQACLVEAERRLD